MVKIKRFISFSCLFLFVTFFSTVIQSQTYNFSETLISGQNNPPEALIGVGSEVANQINELVIVAVDSCDYQNSLLPAWFNQNYSSVNDYFTNATFGNYNVVIDWLRKDATHAFIMPRSNIPKFDRSCEHVHSYSNVIDVLRQVDSLYNFNAYDINHDGQVNVHFTSINITGTHNGGVTGERACFTFTSNDSTPYSFPIVINVVRQTRGYNKDAYFGVFYHESGHSLFNFPDMDHSGTTDFNHYGIGGFDNMSGGGFQGVPSLYNPWFRHARGWFTPTQISSNDTLTLQDFQNSHSCYLYSPGSLPGNSMPNERFYISYHDRTNQFYFTWPYKDPIMGGGVLIWHVKKDIVQMLDDYNDYRIADIDIEAEHGKYVWQEYSDRVVNTGVENALIGRDSLEIRKIVGGAEVQGPYYAKDAGSASIFYTPNDGKNFTFYSNPNSNWYVNSNSENYAQSITSGFSMKNLRNENGAIKADFKTNDYSITSNTTLAGGKWYINSTTTVASGVSLTIQSGTTLSFNNGASLIVNGALAANGTNTNKITFDFISPNSTTQNGIKFNSGSSGTINYAIVKNGYYGVSVTGNPTGTINLTNSVISNSSYAVYISGNTSSNVNITGCDIGTSSGGINLNSAVANIDGCAIHNITTYGGGAVVFNNSGGTIKNCNIQNNSIATNGISILNNSSPYVFQNTIANNTLNGVYVLQASPSLQSNVISTTGYGHAAVSNNSYSHTLFGKTSYPFDGYNTISGSYYGIYVGDHSLIQAGYSDIARYNRILGNTYNTYVTGTSTLYAKNDWWGASQPDTTKFYKEAGSYFYYLPYLTTDPSGSQSIVSSRGLSASANAVSTGVAYTPEEELLLKAKELQEKNQLSEAIGIYEELIKTNGEKSIGEIALLELNNIYRNTKDKNIKDYFKEFKLSKNNKKRLYPIALEILSFTNKREKNFTESLDDCETLIKEFSSTEHEKNALMNKFFLYYDNNDFTSAKTVVEKLANSYTESPEAAVAINLLSMQEAVIEQILPKAQVANNTTTENLLESYEINNYPNPFNPVTTIAYQLPKEGLVTISVFDILGKEIKTLVNEYKEIGKYTVQFDASSLTSGMYIYQLRSNDYTSTKKMLLLK